MENGLNGKRLVLHFDLRNTILVADSITEIKVEGALNSYLTSVTWGRADAGGEWRFVSDRLSLAPPAARCETFYRHLERRLVTAPGDRAELRRRTGDFTAPGSIGHLFRNYYERHLEMLVWRHEQKNEKLTMTGADGRSYHYLLPSYFKLLQWLARRGKEFAVVIRTFGEDARNVLLSTQHAAGGGRHPDFPERLRLRVNPWPRRIHRYSNGTTIEIPNPGEGEKNYYTEDSEIYALMTSHSGVCAYQDDFTFWQQNGYDSSAGKPFWLKPSDQQVQQIFFDDNIRVGESDSIVDVRLVQHDGSAAAARRAELRALVERCLVQVDLLSAIANPDYFIEKVLLCEQNCEKFGL